MAKTRLLRVAIPGLLGFSLATPGLKAQTAPAPAPVPAPAPAPVSAPASSEAGVADAVELKNGGYLRGLIVEVEPGSHIGLRMPDGQVRRIPVAEIASADRGGKPLALGAPAGDAPKAGAAAVAVVPTAAAPPPVVPGRRANAELDRILAAIPGPRIKLTAESNRSAYLQRRIGEADENTVAYHLVCKLPCIVELPAADPVTYRVSNMRLDPTDWFEVPKYNARMRVDLTSDMWPVWTNAMLVGGVVFGVTGGAFLGINALTGQEPWARDTGYVLVGVSGAFFVASGLFWLLSPKTSYTLERMP